MKDNTSRVEQDVLNENQPKVRYIIKLWNYVFHSAKIMCLIFMGLTIALSLLRPVLAFIWGEFVDSANQYQSGMNLFPTLSLVIAYFLLNFVIGLLERFTARQEEIERLDIVQANRFQELLDSRMYRKLSRLDPEYVEIPKINDTMNRVFQFTSNGWSGLNGGLMLPAYLVVSKAVSVISIALSLYLINPWLCLILLIAPIPTLYLTYVGNKLQFKFLKDNSKLYRECDYFQKLMLGEGAKELKVLTLFDFFYGKWKTRIDEYTIREKDTYFKRSLLGTINNLISGLASVGATVFAIVLMTMGRISIGGLGAVMSLIQTLIADISVLFQSVANVLSKKNESAMFFDLMDLPEERQDGEKLSKTVQIEANRVKYRYPLTENYVIDGIDLSIQKGEKVAFVGENGAGKTTFVKLMCGLLQPSEGIIRINGKPGGEIQPNSRYDTLSTVSQEPARYTTFTVGDNVFLGDPNRNRSENEIDAALEFAGLDGIDKDAMLGKDTGGTDLSGGQWQKIAIARGYYRGRDFIILDEPTGNLDPLAEAEVFRKYLELAHDKTVIMVTHRISVASLADRIIVFKDGKIAEDGTHAKLMEKEGEYKRLYTTQAKWYDR